MEKESRLIEAHDLWADIMMLPHNGDMISSEEVEKTIMDAPTVDAVEVVHGRWIYHECVSSYDGAISGYSCSKCNAFVNEEVFDNDEFHKDFCGNCGAKMDGGNEDV